MTTTLLIGILAAFVATTLAAGVRRAPVRASCPVCGTTTESVQFHPALRKAAPELRIRWCPQCSWKGVGRHGAEAVPGKPTAHGSGFRWGSERLPQDFGFRFAPVTSTEAQAPTEPPSHPSGFRFAEGEEPPAAPKAHPSGFRWSDDEAAASTDAPSAPLAFRWAEPRPRPGFRWAEPRGGGTSSFRWKA